LEGRREMGAVTGFWSSTIGKKAIVAVTGLALVLFVIVHMLGNLQVFLGQDAINHYAHVLKSMPVLLWTARVGLLVVFVLHVVATIQLRMRNMEVRPAAYAVDTAVKASWASRYMALTGSIVLLYVIGHLCHFTIEWTKPEYGRLLDAQGRPDVYTMIVAGFQVVPISVGYIVAMLLLYTHLSHGIASIFQSMGFNSPGFREKSGLVGPLLAAFIVVGFISVPAAVLVGAVDLPPDVLVSR
jgi:succinate dehydrogenase / fumarate reductase cytochrome b subunit